MRISDWSSDVCSSDDLNQVAMMALVRAVDRFDPSFKVRFATFAVPTMVGELRRHFRDKTWSVRVSRRLKDLHLRSEEHTSELQSLMRISYAVFCLTKKKNSNENKE